jgi:diguanylate cyclase (GGDEF)-like protein
VIDIDHFKDLNDEFGHPVGDETLRAVAHLLQSEMRPHDFLFRYGGEEFVVILPETTLKGAYVLGERFRRAVQRAPWKHRPITVSVGAATAEETMESPTDLIQAGDGALYHAKKNGRNRVSTTDDVTAMG